MKPRLRRSQFRLACLVASLAAMTLPNVLSHELTRSAYEGSLDLHEGKVLAKVQSLRAVASTDSRAADTCQLSIRLVDSETQKPMPGLLRVTNPDGATVPLAGLVNRGIKLRNNHPAKDWFALNEATAIPVPQSRLTIEAFSGLDTELAKLTVDLSGKPRADVILPLKSFFSDGRKGWFSGNTHLHLSGLTRAQADEYLETLPRSDGLDVLFVSHLERAKADQDYISNSYSLAELQRLGGTNLLFGNGEEHRHNFEGYGQGYGHVMFLNIRQLIRPVSIGAGIMGEGPDWPPLRHGITQARGGGATIIWCHNTFGHEDTPDWLAGLVHAHNIFDGDGSMHGTYEDTFYRYLNIGLKVPFSTGTDWFIYDFSRVYARLDQTLTVQNWLASLAAGRTFISNGPFLELRADKYDIGDTIHFAHPETISVSGRATGRHDFKRIELVHNGKVVHSAMGRAVNGHFEAELNFSLAADTPGWFALRIPGGSLDSSGAVIVPPATPIRARGDSTNEMGETLFAHTSPIYIELAGKSLFKKDAAEALLANMESALRDIPPKAKFTDDSQRNEVLKLYRDGIEMLRKRLSE